MLALHGSADLVSPPPPIDCTDAAPHLDTLTLPETTPLDGLPFGAILVEARLGGYCFDGHFE